MSRKKLKGQYRMLAIVWTLAAISMLVGLIRQSPNASIFALVIFLLSMVSAIIWWSAYWKASKNDDSK